MSHAATMQRFPTLIHAAHAREPRLRTRTAHHTLAYAYCAHRSRQQRRARASFFLSWGDHERAGARCVDLAPIGYNHGTLGYNYSYNYTMTPSAHALADLLRGKPITHDRCHTLRLQASAECLHRGLYVMAEKWAERALLLRLRKGPKRTPRNSRHTALALMSLLRAIQAQATEEKRGGWVYPVHVSHGRGNRLAVLCGGHEDTGGLVDHRRAHEAHDLYQVIRTLSDVMGDVMASTFYLHSALHPFARGAAWRGGDDRLRAMEMYGIFARAYMGLGDWTRAAQWMHRHAESTDAFYGSLSEEYRHSMGQLGQIYLCGGELTGAEVCFRVSLRRVRAHRIRDNRGKTRNLPLRLMTRNETLLEGRTEALRLEQEWRRKSRWGYESEESEEEPDEEYAVKEEEENKAEEEEAPAASSVAMVAGQRKASRASPLDRIALPAVAGATTWEPALKPGDRNDFEDPAKSVIQDPDDLVARTGSAGAIERDALMMGRTLLELKLFDRAEEFLASCVDPAAPARSGKLVTSAEALSEMKSMFQNLPTIKR
jgi:hypothetical protein